MKRSIYFAFAAISLATLAGCGSKQPLAAVVNGQPILLNDYYRHLELKPSVQVVVNPAQLQQPGSGPIPTQPYNGQVVGSLGLQAMKDMVMDTLVKQLATDDNVYPSAAQIKQELDDQNHQNPAFMTNLTGQGYTLDMIRDSIAVDLAKYNLMTEGITVTDNDINDYIKNNPKAFEEPEGVSLLYVLVPQDKKAAVDKALGSGEQFINVAKEFTIAPNAAQMQYQFPVKYVQQLQQMKPLYEAVTAMASHKPDPLTAKATDWFQFPEGWAKFYVSAFTPARRLQIDDSMRRRVKRQLALQKGSAGKDLDSRVNEKLRSSKIEISIDILKDPWKKAMDQLQSTPESGSKNSAAANKK